LWLHGADQERATLKHAEVGELPRELTLSYQCLQAQAMHNQREEKRVQRRWSRMLRSLLIRQWTNIRKAALRELASAREADATARLMGNRVVEDVIPNEFQHFASNLETAPCEDRNRRLTAEDELAMAEQLGLDIATYRMLRQLEEREILPEDYDLLGRLDEAVKPATLCLEELDRFPTRVHSVGCKSFANSTSRLPPAFGFEFWRLPMPILLEELKSECKCLPADFWKIPLPVADDDDANTTASTLEDSSFTCGVCLLNCEVGDELRCLPCGHSFHRECIDHWLLNSSVACPIDKRDVREL
jgi:hypothetical protein